MLVAHRRGAPTALLSFAKSWDRFAGARRGAREISRRELAILSCQLEASLLGEAASEMVGAIREHHALVARRDALCADPTGEIVARRLRPRGYSSSPGRLNMTSGITHAGETLSR